MSRRVLASRLAPTLAVVASACGTAQITDGDANSIAANRDGLSAAVRSVSQLRDSAQAPDINGKVDRDLRQLEAIGYMSAQLQVSQSNPVIESVVKTILEDLGAAIPSLVVGEPSDPVGLDTDATRDYLRYRGKNPARALHTAAATIVRSIGNDLEGKSPSAQITTLRNQSVKSLLDSEVALVRPVWPDLADQLNTIRARLH
jgi:hypothetical protein